MMDSPLNLLILTDSIVHGPVESIYGLSNRLRQFNAVARVDVADRQDPANGDFFDDPRRALGRILTTDESFVYTPEKRFYRSPGRRGVLTDYDAVLLRLPRKNSMAFFAALDAAYPQLCFVNRPGGIGETGDKQFLLHFPDLCPPIQLCRTVADVESLRARFAIVLKPLNDSGGRGIVRIEGDRVWLGNDETRWLDFMPQLEAHLAKEPYLGMQFLKNVDQGDKRLIVVNGEIVSAALRTPPAGSWLANVSMGGKSSMSEPTPEELHMAKVLAPVLKDKGVVLFGFDTLVDDGGLRVLSEINTSCVNGIYPAEIHSGRPVLAETATLIIDYIQEYIAKS